MPESLIDCIETDQFTLGMLGRSATRSFVNYITRYYYDFVWENRRLIHLGIAPEPQDMPLPSHHPYSFTDIDTFNSIPNKIMVVRNPIDRAESGSEVQFNPNFHGQPALQYLDWDMIDYIIPFEDINLYLNNTEYVHASNREGEREMAKVLSTMHPLQHYREAHQDWSVDEYDFTREIETYNLVLKTKEKLPPSLWVELLSKVTACNIPSKHLLKW